MNSARKQFKARVSAKGGTCALCGAEYEKGTPILTQPGLGTIHIACPLVDDEPIAGDTGSEDLSLAFDWIYDHETETYLDSLGDLDYEPGALTRVRDIVYHITEEDCHG